MEFTQTFKLWEQDIPLTTPDDASRVEHFQDHKGGIDRLTDVTEPTITWFPASGQGPHPAVLVCPGGGYSILAWNHEGRDICGMLNQNGFSAFLLKYRCPDRRAAAHADAARAMRMIRHHSGQSRRDRLLGGGAPLRDDFRTVGSGSVSGGG